MNQPIHQLPKLLANMAPELQPGRYAFVCLGLHKNPDGIAAIASFREKEGWTLVVEELVAHQNNLTVLFSAAWITLTVNSELAAVGLTASVSQALAAHNIACNMMAGAFHDHLFVPWESVEDAMQCLRDLQHKAMY